MSNHRPVATSNGEQAFRHGTLSAKPPALNGRKTIGVLMDYMVQFIESYQSQIRNACHVMGRTFDVNVVLVYGGAVASPGGTPVAQNAVFDLVHRDYFDGLILLSSTLSNQCGPDGLSRFAERFSSLPRCSVGLQLPGIPSVIIDNRRSMQAVVEHMIVTHGCRRIAYINGPPQHPEAQQRQMGYREMLEREGIAFDPNLVVDGYFITGGGRRAMEALLESGNEFDAVVAANDSMALAAVQVLRRRGYRVPRDIPVTGYDNLHLSGLESPPLTTVAQPFAAMTEQAFRLVLDQIEGKRVELLTELVAGFVVRRSCGCGHLAAAPIRLDSLPSLVTSAEYLQTEKASLKAEMLALAPFVTKQSVLDLERLLAALRDELDGLSVTFLQVLEDILLENQGSHDYVQWLRRSLDCLRQHLRPCASAFLENLWYDARDFIESSSMRLQLQHRLQLDESYARLLEISEQAWRDLDLLTFRQCLAKTLPGLGIQTASISLYTNASLNELEPYIVLQDGNLLDLPNVTYPARALMAPQITSEPRRRTLVIFSLVVELRQFGVVAFEDVAQLSGFQMLRDHVSTALGGILLHHELIQKTAQNERSLLERQATAKRIEALSVLAGGVAHDLNNAIGPLVALPEVILRELEQVIAGVDPRELRADLETIKSSALRAAQTIKDLLTLGRQGRTAKVPLDLGCTVTACLSAEWAHLARQAGNQARLVVEVPDYPLTICGSEAHLVRAVSNLVRNAVESLRGPGEVTVRVHATQVQAPILGYELIEPGDYAVVVVSDSGHGILPGEIGRIFEPFYSKKDLSECRGSGLGLAIVHGVVKEHEGFLDVTSQPNLGTAFTLYFPRTRDNPQPQPKQTTLHQGSARILIVDDEPIQLRTGRRVLSGLGYQIETTESGVMALNWFARAAAERTSPFDLVILDMNLKEEVDGLERFEQIRTLFPKQRVILTSGHAPNERVELAFEKGLLWLSKPYTSAALTAAVENALTEHPSQSRLRLPPKSELTLPKSSQ